MTVMTNTWRCVCGHENPPITATCHACHSTSAEQRARLRRHAFVVQHQRDDGTLGTPTKELTYDQADGVLRVAFRFHLRDTDGRAQLDLDNMQIIEPLPDGGTRRRAWVRFATPHLIG